MKSGHLKLAGVVTVFCGSMSSLDTWAAAGDSPTIATGEVTTIQSEPKDSAYVYVIDDEVRPQQNVVATESQNPPDAMQVDEADVVTPARESRAEAADSSWGAADLVAVSESRLDDMRGGFDLPSGLVVSFGVSRAAFVNGNLVAQTSFNIPDIANMTAQQAQMLASANTGALLQVGPHNSVQQGALPALTGSVIQNSLSDQQIQALTTINAGVNSLGAFKAMNFLSTMNSALAGAVRPR
ncbi:MULTISPECIES: hypothetical protein [unclassified Paraburkholderia]|uniref:hypothetical protein n=1 Tax=unclassified Paraburkholderia TaxID=2615204 RepID=UPI002AAF1CD8|nr:MULTISPECIES: hypothetical protein [unclassified Paraburkholderia]